MSYPRIVHAVFHSPWAIRRAWLGSIFSLLHSRVFGEAPPPLTLASSSSPARHAHLGTTRYGRDASGRLTDLSTAIHQRARAEADGGEGIDGEKYDAIIAEEEDKLPAGQILHVFASGIMGKHLSIMEEICAGGLSVDRLQLALREARDDDKVSAIMLHLDTPGGVSTGIAETAALVRQIAQAKTIAAFSDSCTASAGYWSIAPADAIYITPSADVGSIGVYCALVDYTEWCAKAGIKVDLVKDGTYKGAGYPGTAITEEQRALIEADVMEISRMFKGDVRAARAPRAAVSDDTMQGQTFMGQKAIEAGLADTLVNDLDEALQDLASAL